jgi:hypothetical protein
MKQKAKSVTGLILYAATVFPVAMGQIFFSPPLTVLLA